MGSQTQRERYARSKAGIVGVDAGKFHHVLVVRRQNGDNSKPFKFAVTREGFDAAAAFIRKETGDVPPGEVLVGIEFAGYCGFTLAYYLDKLGYEVVSVRPIDTKSWKRVAHRRAIKTDAKDAEGIVSLLNQGAWVTFPFRSPEHTSLRYLTSAVERVTLQRSAVITRLWWALHILFPELEVVLGTQSFSRNETPLALLEAFPTPKSIREASREEILVVVRKASRGGLKDAFVDRVCEAARDTLALDLAQEPIGQEIRLLVSSVRFLNDQREQLEALVEEVLALLPEAPFLLSVPGVGAMTAAMFFGSLGDVRAYESSRQVLAMAGLGLTEKSSGTQQGAKRITKEGRAVMRRHMYLLVMRLTTKSGPYRARYDQLRAGGSSHRAAVVAIARALLRVMYSVARRREMFDPAKVGMSLVGSVSE